MQINLSHRNLIDFDPSAFSTDEDREILRSISRLDISFNSISSLQGLYWLSTLTALDVSHNSIPSLRGLPLPLRQLNASFNVLNDVEDLSSLTQLEVLLVSHNQITTLSGIPATVRILDLSSNRLISVAGLDKFTVLEELQLRQNMIQKVEELEELKSLTSLRAVTLSENPVTCTRRRHNHVAAVCALLPQGLEVHDLPSALLKVKSPMPLGNLHSIAHSDASSIASCEAPRNEYGMNISAVSCPTNERVSPVASSHEIHSHASSSLEHRAGQRSGDETHCHEDEEERGPPLEQKMTLCSADEYLSAATHSSFMSGDVSLFHEVDARATGIRAQGREDFVLEKLRLELRECQRFCSFYKKENNELRVQIQQLQSTTEKQARANTMLLEWIERLQHGHHVIPGYEQERCKFPAPLDDATHLGSGGLPLASGCEESYLPRRDTEYQSGSNCSHQSQGVEEAMSGEGLSLKERAEIRHGARSLATLFMSLVPTSTGGASGYRKSSAVSSTTSTTTTNAATRERNENDNIDGHHSNSFTTRNNESGSSENSGSNLQQSLTGDGRGRKRTVSFGGFAYYPSPP